MFGRIVVRHGQHALQPRKLTIAHGEGLQRPLDSRIFAVLAGLRGRQFRGLPAPDRPNTPIFRQILGQRSSPRTRHADDHHNRCQRLIQNFAVALEVVFNFQPFDERRDNTVTGRGKPLVIERSFVRERPTITLQALIEGRCAKSGQAALLHGGLLQLTRIECHVL